MSAVADVCYGLMFVAGGSALFYCAGWVFSGAIDDIERLYNFIKRFMNGD